MRAIPPHARQVTSGGSCGAIPAAWPGTSSPVARSRSLTRRRPAPHSAATVSSSGVWTSTRASMPSSVHVSSSAGRSGRHAAAMSSTAFAPSQDARAICSGSTIRSLHTTGKASAPPSEPPCAYAHATLRSRYEPPYEVRSELTSTPSSPRLAAACSASSMARSGATGTVTPSSPVGEARFKSMSSEGRSRRQPSARPSAYEPVPGG